MNSKRALLFPGQGAHGLQMLQGIRNTTQFTSRYELVCTILNDSPQEQIEQGNQKYLNQNAVSSLLTVLVSSISLDIYFDTFDRRVEYLTGYSVGQWTALYAANSISYQQLVQIVKIRADLMDQCMIEQPGGMIAVIGVSEEILTEFCTQLQSHGNFITISNYNCVGQYTLAGTERSIELAMEQLAKLKPKKFVRLPVSGAWHCLLLRAAEQQFFEFLQEVDLQPPQIPVINNVTGELLPNNTADLKRQMAVHLSHPVRWEAGMKTLIRTGCREFVEIGYGNLLTKFGFFIDRAAEHKAFYVK